MEFQGLHYGQFDSDLIPHLGRKVYLRIDQHNLSAVSVWSTDDRFICLARANQLLPANAGHEILAAAIAEKRRHRKLMREYHSQRPRLAEDLPDRMLRAAAAIRNPAGPGVFSPGARRTSGGFPEPPPLRPVRSPLEDQLPAVRAAFEFRPLRLAAGANSSFVYRDVGTGDGGGDVKKPALLNGGSETLKESMGYNDSNPTDSNKAPEP